MTRNLLEVYRRNLRFDFFWASRGLNDLADKGDFERITKRINGGYNGLKERQAYYVKAMLYLGAKAQ